jgi:hypothetical protein
MAMTRPLPVDVAVMKLPYIKERRIVTFRQCSPCPEGESDQLSGVAEPFDYVVVAGFPRDIGFTLKKPRPFARGGLVGLVAEEKFVSTVVSEGDKKLRKYLQEGAFLVDIEVDPGNSGSPVIVKNPFQSVRLAGLVTGSNPSLDYGIVTPVSQIVETLEHARDADMNKPAWFLLSEDEDSN